VLFSLLVASASALPQNYDYNTQGGSQGPIIPILRDERFGPTADGSYSFDFETGNGISRQEQGQPGLNGAVVSQGAWSFTFPDGSPA
ncbi:UNVERIFIED_CONTAM: hypothetical protein GTU68_012351, partial [Idotea baltica]|nr:hypothetical protein [Idotea baltica]